VNDAVRLHQRKGRARSGLALLEGPHLVEEAVVAAASVVRVFHLPDDGYGAGLAARSGGEAVPVTRRVLARLATTPEPQSPIAVMDIPEDELPAAGSALVAWGVGDPGNLGTMIRTAAAFELAFAAGPGSADPWSPKALRAAAGGHFRTTVARVEETAELGDRTVTAAVVSGGVAPWQAPEGDQAILVGDEAGGLPDEVIAAAGATGTVPMPGETESLNAAVVGALLAYEVALRRFSGGAPGGD
jgi:TrmH family RNA methyltransferase